jgi:hypothetical protein
VAKLKIGPLSHFLRDCWIIPQEKYCSAVFVDNPEEMGHLSFVSTPGDRARTTINPSENTIVADNMFEIIQCHR